MADPTVQPIRFVARRHVSPDHDHHCVVVIEHWSDDTITTRTMGDQEQAAWLAHQGADRG